MSVKYRTRFMWLGGGEFGLGYVDGLIHKSGKRWHESLGAMELAVDKYNGDVRGIWMKFIDVMVP